jgi:hypothetical protein
VLCPVP